MRIIADLHIHSKYSRGCSKDLDIKNLEKWARIKGLGLLGTGDFTHPEWEKELKENLSQDGSGILKTKSGFPFVLQTEISLIYSHKGVGKRVHVVILAPDFATTDRITQYFKSNGRVDYDGRPIFKISCRDLVRDLREISEDIEVIPAHVWTPWFSLFGSKSGFDDIDEAFGDQTKYIHALETGLSSDPEMNEWISKIDNYNLVSFSDCHSYWPWRIGREATVFDINLDYTSLIKAIRTGEGLIETIEVDPNYGKYHFDGHRSCGISFSPPETKKANGICPVCKKPLTIGVLNRVLELSDREKSGNPRRYKTLVPLSDLISLSIKSSVSSKKTWDTYNKLIKRFGNEFKVLLDAKKDDMMEIVGADLAGLIIRNRKGNIEVIPGYDGEYGIPIISGVDRQKRPKRVLKNSAQRGLGDFF